MYGCCVDLRVWYSESSFAACEIDLRSVTGEVVELAGFCQLAYFGAAVYAAQPVKYHVSYISDIYPWSKHDDAVRRF